MLLQTQPDVSSEATVSDARQRLCQLGKTAQDERAEFVSSRKCLGRPYSELPDLISVMSMETYSLYTSVDGARLLRDLELRISDDFRLVWGEDPIRDARPLADIREIRLWTEKPKLADHSGRAMIKFADGKSVKVSGAYVTGAPDAVRAQTYIEFLRCLHRSLDSEQRQKIRFLRGFANGSPVKGWTFFAIAVAVDLAVFAFLWTNLRADAQWFVRPGLIIFALAGLVGAASLGQATYGRRYDPNRIPKDLTPL